MDFTTDQVSSYRVEVSGWDASERFFVEKTSLSWGRDDKKEIRVRATLREGSVLFVRLIQPLTNGTNFPIAYQAQQIGMRNEEGYVRVYLAQLRPRPAYKQGREVHADAASLA